LPVTLRVIPLPYSGIGKDWNYRAGDVLPEDREGWERLAVEDTGAVQDFRAKLETTPHPPDPYVHYSAYDVGWTHEEELHRSYLHALQRVTEPDEWVYALDCPDVCWLYCYRFWPHRAQVWSRWYASPVPNGDDEYFLAEDFSWGVLAFFSPSPEAWEVSGGCAFGQRLIDAFDADPPPGWRGSPTR